MRIMARILFCSFMGNFRDFLRTAVQINTKNIRRYIILYSYMVSTRHQNNENIEMQTYTNNIILLTINFKS